MYYLYTTQYYCIICTLHYVLLVHYTILHTYYLYTMQYYIRIICTHYAALFIHATRSLTFLHGEDPADTVVADPGQWLGEVVVGPLPREIRVWGTLPSWGRTANRGLTAGPTDDIVYIHTAHQDWRLLKIRK